MGGDNREHCYRHGIEKLLAQYDNVSVAVVPGGTGTGTELQLNY